MNAFSLDTRVSRQYCCVLQEARRTDVQRVADIALVGPGGSRAFTGGGANVDMSQVRTPAEARQAAEEAAHGWHAKLKVEHPKLDLEEKAELCKRIEREHRWPNPMSDEEAVERGSVFRLPIRCLFHATGYEACRSQERGWVNEIKAGRKANPWAPFNAGLVAVQGLKSRNEFSLKSALRGEYRCKVFGHQHCFQGTLECHEEGPLQEFREQDLHRSHARYGSVSRRNAEHIRSASERSK